jgi:hypothetical protein
MARPSFHLACYHFTAGCSILHVMLMVRFPFHIVCTPCQPPPHFALAYPQSRDHGRWVQLIITLSLLCFTERQVQKSVIHNHQSVSFSSIGRTRIHPKLTAVCIETNATPTHPVHHILQRLQASTHQEGFNPQGYKCHYKCWHSHQCNYPDKVPDTQTHFVIVKHLDPHEPC